jgi:hypothetical protein
MYMKYFLILIFPFYFIAQTEFTSWKAMNLKGKVKMVTEKSYEPVFKNGVWSKQGYQYGNSYFTYTFSVNGIGATTTQYTRDGETSITQTIVPQYNSDSVLTGTKVYGFDKRLTDYYEVTEVYKKLFALQVKHYKGSQATQIKGSQANQTLINELDSDQNVKHMQIVDALSKRVEYEVWYKYDKRFNPVMKIQYDGLFNRKDTTRITYLKFDIKGNWISKVETLGAAPGMGHSYDKSVLYERTFVYY